ncbi:MAG: HD domain-containing protein, partial [Burkholderiales bacterium]|nr:HD domain-containing protein [Burkholderiales bacterium]
MKTNLKLVEPGDPAALAWLDGLGDRYTPAEMQVLRAALDHAVREYAGRELASGEPLLRHVLETAGILAALRLDHETLAAALLYPCQDIAPGALQALREKFGAAVADLAEGVGRMAEIGTLSSRPVESRPEQQAAQLESLRKMLLAMVQDVRVVLIKLADHLQELRHFAKSGGEGPRREAAELTRDIFAPLANRLGVWQIKWEL